MKMGISVWSFPTEMSLGEIFETAKKAGFEGVEVSLDEIGEISLESTAEDMEKVKTLAERAGIKLYSVATGLYWKYSLTSNDDEIRSKAKNIVRKQLQVAKWLGCDTILVVPGAVGVDFIPGFEVVDYDIAFRRSKEALMELKEDAEKLGVRIAVENVWNKFLISPLEMRNFIDEFNSEYICSYFDVGNVVATGYPEQWIKILNKRIKKIHFKDFKREVGNLNGFVDLLSGDVDYPAVIKALKDIDYNDWVTAEMSVYAHYKDQIVYNTANSMRRILDV